MSVAAGMEVWFLGAEALLAREMSRVHFQTSAGLAQAEPAHPPLCWDSLQQSDRVLLAR